MMKKIMVLFIGSIISQIAQAAKIAVFVSFSMPHLLLMETLRESSQLKIPAYLNGFYHDSMQKTVVKILALSKEIPNLSLQIDPTAFERFEISQVPALVIEKNNSFDVIYGNLPLHEGIMRMAKGDSKLSELEIRSILRD